MEETAERKDPQVMDHLEMAEMEIGQVHPEQWRMPDLQEIFTLKHTGCSLSN